MRRALMAIGVVIASACGASSAHAAISCSQGWTPNERTFADPKWRAHSVRLGPVTLLGARRIGGRDVAAFVEDGGAVKIGALVRPRTPVTIRVRTLAPRGAEVGIGITEAARERVLRYAPCPPVPRDARAIASVPDVGFPLFVSLSRAACVRVRVDWPGGRAARVIAIGAGDC